MGVEKQVKQRPARPKKRRGFKLKLLFLSFLVAFVLSSFLLAGFMVLILVQNYEIDESKLAMREATVIYDRHGNEISKLYIENRRYIPIDELPQQVVDAFVAIEDQRFFEHQGIDFRAIARALYRDILARSMVEGGSTITQQLAKNVFLTHEKKLMRKTEEALIALKLEQRYTKQQILEMYLNYIYFGHGAYGIQAAAQVYFGKDAEDLELAEIALLAALPKAPSHYSPLIEGNEERSENRRKLVLRVMAEQGKITEEERRQAEETVLQFSQRGVTDNPALYTYIDMVLDEAEKKYNISHDELHTGGFKIYTALDVKAQEAMYEAFNKDSPVSQELFPEPGPEQIVQGSMVIIDHRTGGVVAAIGGRDYVRKGLNRAVSDARQPGSTFKPISVYAPALEAGWEPYDLLRDELIDYGGYQPRNYDGKYRGKVTMLEAVKYSYNAPAVWLLNEIGVGTGVSYAQAFGFDKVERKLGIALGDVGASPLQMASAFGTFANHGLRMEPYLIERIVDRHDQLLIEHQPKSIQVVTEQTAWYMTKMLEQVVREGTGTRARMKHPVAGKTGTTQSPSGYKGIRDAWFVGYTPQYAAAVWIGFDQLDKQHVLNSSGGNHPAKLFKYVMEKALEDVPVEAFKKPSGVKDLEKPIPLPAIEDLQGFITLHKNLSLTIDLVFTPLGEAGPIAYQIYRTAGDTLERQLVGQVAHEQLLASGGWSDHSVELGRTYTYEVVPINLRTGEEGQPSNRLTIKVDPSSPLFRISADVTQEELFRWLMEIEGKMEPEQLDEQKREEEWLPPTQELELDEDYPEQDLEFEEEEEEMRDVDVEREPSPLDQLLN